MKIHKTNKYSIKIPADVSVIYSKKKKTLTIIGPLKRKSLKLKLKVFLNNAKKTINLSDSFFYNISNKEKKQIRAIRNSTIANIKHLLIESSTVIFQKLNIKGVGYRAVFTETFNQKLITLKLGHSHLIYIKTPEHLSVDCPTKTKICIFGNSYDDISNFSALIRANKKPDVYKGKGILYEDEIVILKEGKKI